VATVVVRLTIIIVNALARRSFATISARFPRRTRAQWPSSRRSSQRRAFHLFARLSLSHCVPLLHSKEQLADLKVVLEDLKAGREPGKSLKKKKAAAAAAAAKTVKSEEDVAPASQSQSSQSSQSSQPLSQTASTVKNEKDAAASSSQESWPKSVESCQAKIARVHASIKKRAFMGACRRTRLRSLT
jgi:hypothetical protein